MIPRDYITEWRARAPWADNAQVEQDLAICRTLVSIFSHPVLNDALAFSQDRVMRNHRSGRHSGGPHSRFLQ